MGIFDKEGRLGARQAPGQGGREWTTKLNKCRILHYLMTDSSWGGAKTPSGGAGVVTAMFDT